MSYVIKVGWAAIQGRRAHCWRRGPEAAARPRAGKRDEDAGLSRIRPKPRRNRRRSQTGRSDMRTVSGRKRRPMGQMLGIACRAGQGPLNSTHGIDAMIAPHFRCLAATAIIKRETERHQPESHWLPPIRRGWVMNWTISPIVRNALSGLRRSWKTNRTGGSCQSWQFYNREYERRAADLPRRAGDLPPLRVPSQASADLGAYSYGCCLGRKEQSGPAEGVQTGPLITRPTMPLGAHRSENAPSRSRCALYAQGNAWSNY